MLATRSLGKMLGFIKAKPQTIGIIVCIIVLILVGYKAVTTIQKADDYNALKSEYDELQTELSEAQNKLEQLEDTQKRLEDTQERLEYSEQQLSLVKESANSLKEQVAGLNAEKDELNNELEKLLQVKPAVPVITRTTLEEQIDSLSELVTKKYIYRNATKNEEGKEWFLGTMPFSETKFVAMYDGTITAGIDLSEVKFDVNQQTKTITVTIPESRIFDHNIPQETINVLEVKNSLFNSVSFNDYNRFISAEKEAMNETAIGQGILEEADKEAREVLKAFLGNMPGVGNDDGEYKLEFK